MEFSTDRDGLYRANLYLRTASRVLVRVAEFHADTFHELERRARKVPWREYLAAGVPVRFRVTSRKSKLYHQRAIEQRLAGAVHGTGARPRESGAAADPDGGGDAVLVVVRVFHDQVTVSVDSSGELLHRRGYRLAGGKAPFRETLAAGMLLEGGYDGTRPLVDPMCGSGTIPIEAALLARRIPPGLTRRFGFQAWPDFDAAQWAGIMAEAAGAVLPRAPAPILGSDRDRGGIDGALGNAIRAGVADDITFRACPLSAIEPPAGRGHVVTNPPYGVRVGERRKLRNLFAQFGNVLRGRYPGWTLVMLSAHRALEGQIRLPLESRLLTSNGGIRVRLVTGAVPSGAPTRLR